MLPDEIIVVDDHSPDDTCEIVRKLQSQSPVALRLIELAQNHGGPVGPMNIGVDAARNDYVGMLDHDDRMLPQRIEMALPILKADPSLGIVFNQFDSFDDKSSGFRINYQRYDYLGTNPKKISATESFRDLIYEDYNYGGAGGMMFRKSMWREIHGFRSEFRIVWDFDFALRSAASDWDVYYIPQALYEHREHANNLETIDGGQRMLRELFVLTRKLLRHPLVDSKMRFCLKQKIEKLTFMIADHEILKKNYSSAAYYYGQALLNRRQMKRALRGFLRIPYRSIRQALRLSNKGDPPK